MCVGAGGRNIVENIYRSILLCYVPESALNDLILKHAHLSKFRRSKVLLVTCLLTVYLSVSSLEAPCFQSFVCCSEVFYTYK